MDGSARWLHKTRFTNELNALRPGTALSNDRLKRVLQRSIEHLITTGNDDATDDDSDMLGIGQDFAMAFENELTGKHVAWYGHVSRVKCVERGKKQLWRRPFRLDDDPENRLLVEVYAQWYRDTSPNEFKYDVGDSKPYLARYIVLLVTMERCARTETYSLWRTARESANGALEQLDEEEKATEEAAPAAAESGCRKRGKKRAGEAAAAAAAAPAVAEPSAATRQTAPNAPAKPGTTIVVNADDLSATAQHGDAAAQDDKSVARRAPSGTGSGGERSRGNSKARRRR